MTGQENAGNKVIRSGEGKGALESKWFGQRILDERVKIRDDPGLTGYS